MSRGRTDRGIPRLATRWRVAVDRALAPLGLTHAQYAVLASLSALAAAGPPPNQRALAGHTGLEPLYVSKLCRALAGAGLLDRAPDSPDSRAVRLSLTPAGVSAVAGAVPVVRDLVDRLLAPLGPDRAGVLVRALFDRLLDRVDLTFAQSVALRVAVGTGSVTVADLGPLLVPVPAAAEALSGLAAAGLLGDGTPTAAGRARFAELEAGIAALGARLYGDVPPADLEVAGRVLTEVTERARAELAA